MFKFKRATGALLATTLLLTAAACSSEEDPSEETSPSVSSEASETPTEEVTEEAALEPVADPSEFDKNATFGIVVGTEVSTDKFGEYQQIELSDESPLMELPVDLVAADVYNNFTAEEAQEAYQFMMKFLINEGIDSTLVYDGSEPAANEWLGRNINLFDPGFQDSVSESVRFGTPEANAGFGDVNSANARADLDFVPYPYEKDVARTYVSDVEVKTIDWGNAGSEGIPGISLEVDLTFHRPIIFQDATHYEKMIMTQNYAAYQVDGDWILGYWTTEYNASVAETP